jgi:hypothetical protein
VGALDWSLTGKHTNEGKAISSESSACFEAEGETV